MIKLRLLALALPVVLITALLAAADPTLAADFGAIRGRLTNGTAGGGVPADTEVVLHVFRGDVHVEDRPVRSAADGSFSFDALETGGEYAYQVTASYAGVPYASEPLRFGPGEGEKRVELTVYETTDTNPGLRVRRASIILAGVDVGSQTVQAIELVIIENPADRTYLPSLSGPAGPMGLLRFSLPPGAGDLEAGPGLDEANLFQVDRGFATTAPIPPGAKEVLFRYRFPYRPGRLRIERAVPYPTAELQVLVRRDGPSVEGPDLRPAEPLRLAGESYRLYAARDLPAGRPIELVLGDLPGRWPFNVPLDDVPAPAWGGLGVSLALALVAGYARWARRTGPGETSSPGLDRQALVEELATLDEAFAAGKLAEEAYLARRADAKARLVGLLRLHPVSLVEPGPSGEGPTQPGEAAGPRRGDDDGLPGGPSGVAHKVGRTV